MEFFSLLPTHRANVLVAMAASSLARTLEQQPPRAAVALAVEQLRSIFGNELPAVTGFLTSRWQADPFARGAYSHMPPGASPADNDALAAPVGENLFFAGEATHRQYPGTVHGALLSGQREADRLIQPAPPC
jgi:monoamine oxidase